MNIQEYHYLSNIVFGLSLLLFGVFQVSVQNVSVQYIQGRVLYQYYTMNLSQSQASKMCQSRGQTLLLVDSEHTNDALVNITTTLGVTGAFWIQGRGKSTDWHWASDRSRISDQGCYKDYGGSPDLPREVPLLDTVPELCTTVCAQLGYVYAGLQSGSQCYCGNSYGKYNLSQGAPWCSVSCDGDPNQYCGGWNRNTVYYINGSFSSWAYQQPDDQSGHEFCAVMESASLDHQFSDQSCYYHYNYICQIPLNNCSEVSNYYQEPESCFYLGNTALSWFHARADCKSRGGDLFKIVDEEAFILIQRILTENRRVEKHWIGLVKMEWFTDNNGLVEKFFWLDEQPDRVNWTCLAHTVEGQGWINLDCEQSMPFICTQDIGNFTTTEDIVTTPANTTMSSVTTQTPVKSTANQDTTIMMTSSSFTVITTQERMTSIQFDTTTEVTNSTVIETSDRAITQTVRPTDIVVVNLTGTPESGRRQHNGEDGWNVQKIAILVGVLGGIFLATTIVGFIVLFKLKCRSSSTASPRVAPAGNPKAPTEDNNHNTQDANQKQPDKEEVQRLQKERNAAMAVTCSDAKVKESTKSLESLC